MTRTVLVVGHSEAIGLEFVGACDVLQMANVWCAERGLKPAYRVELVSLRGGPLPLWGGTARVDTRSMIGFRGRFDTLVVVGGQHAVRASDDEEFVAKMRELAATVFGFRHDPDLIHDNGINPEAGVVDAYTFLAPMIDTDRYLSWLHLELAAAGAPVRLGRIHGTLASQHKRLLHDHNAQLIINCTGLGAHQLANDPDLSPHRGAVIRLDNTGRYTPRITAAHCVANDPYTHDQNMIFIVPRGEDRLLLGGLVEPDEWTTNIGLANYPAIRDMLRRNTTFLPALTGAHLVLQGYRLDLEATSEVVAAGFSLVLATVGGPVHRGVDDPFYLVADVE